MDLDTLFPLRVLDGVPVLFPGVTLAFLGVTLALVGVRLHFSGVFLPLAGDPFTVFRGEPENSFRAVVLVSFPGDVFLVSFLGTRTRCLLAEASGLTGDLFALRWFSSFSTCCVFLRLVSSSDLSSGEFVRLRRFTPGNSASLLRNSQGSFLGDKITLIFLGVGGLGRDFSRRDMGPPLLSHLVMEGDTRGRGGLDDDVAFLGDMAPVAKAISVFSTDVDGCKQQH